MRNKVCRWICICVVLCIMALPVHALTVSGPGTAQPCSLTLHYAQNKVGFEDLEIRIYRVAELRTTGDIVPVAPFDAYPIGLDSIDSQREWQMAAETLAAYIAADGLQPDAVGTTDATGTVVFSNLEMGLYFVEGVVAENSSGIYQFDEFMVCLPTSQGGGQYLYDVEATPKCGSYIPVEEYKVTKLWKDSGNSDGRPASVTVDILCDGVLQEQVALNVENNWTYTWRTTARTGKWTVVEREVPTGYRVTITENETTFVITNTFDVPPEIPSTGDTSSLGLYVVMLSVSGLALLFLGTRGGRRKNNEE